MGKGITKTEAIQTYLFRGLEQLSDSIKFDFLSNSHSLHLAIGLELILKAYLIGLEGNKYENLPEDESIRCITNILKNHGHGHLKMANTIADQTHNDSINRLLKCRTRRGITGEQWLKAHEKAFFESRYPHAVRDKYYYQFPISCRDDSVSTQYYLDPIKSDEMQKFCFTFCREVIQAIEQDFNLPILAEIFDGIALDSDADRFRNLFLKDYHY